MLIRVSFPKNYTPLPKGYEVVWVEETEHYLGINEEMGFESVIFSNRFKAREWCFLHAMFQIDDLKIFDTSKEDL